MIVVVDAACLSPRPSGAFFTIPTRSCIVKTVGGCWYGCPIPIIKLSILEAEVLVVTRKRIQRGSRGTLITVAAIVVAVGMVLSTVIIYIDYMRKPEPPASAEGENFLEQLRVEQKRLKEEAGQLEQYLEEYDSSPAVLEHLAQVYSALAEYARWFRHRGAARATWRRQPISTSPW